MERYISRCAVPSFRCYGVRICTPRMRPKEIFWRRFRYLVTFPNFKELSDEQAFHPFDQVAGYRRDYRCCSGQQRHGGHLRSEVRSEEGVRRMQGRCIQSEGEVWSMQGEVWGMQGWKVRGLRRQEVGSIGRGTMGPDTALVRHWRQATDREVADALHAARDSVAAFGEVTAHSGSLIQSWIRRCDVVEFEHYPSGDVVDRRRGSQFYYHAHRRGDLEHGHIHLFWHATAGGRRRHLRSGRKSWTRTAPSHLFAISLDARGLPVGLFTVNRWVTDGHWFDAATTLAFVDRFAVQLGGTHARSARWITAFVRFYLPRIRVLLEQRDRRLARRRDLKRALADKNLEVLSLHALDWASDLDAIEAEAARRGL